MEKTNLHRIAAIASIAIVLLIPMDQTATIFGQPASASPASSLQPTPPLQTDSVNAVTIRAVFHFSSGDEVVDSFKEFQTLNQFLQLSPSPSSSVAASGAGQGGFVSATTTPQFVLRGVIGWDRPHLYATVDKTYQTGGYSNFPTFDMDVWFHRGDKNYRGFDYSSCRVLAYDLDTLRDNDKPYTTKIGGGEAGQKFVYRESFTFQCNGLSYKNPVLEQMIKDQQQEAAEKTDQMLREKFPERYK